MTAELPTPGETVGRYVLDRMIGQGGYGWVFAATRDDGNSFALKILKPRFGGDTAFETRFRQESALAGELVHPNIVRIEEVGRTGDFVFFSMDLLPDSLAGVLGRETTLDEARVSGIAGDIARALAFAHERGVIHRDIKPDNILLAEDGRAVLTDFGIARAVSSYVAATGFNMTIGTPSYISPEQAQGRSLDGRSDVYSLGITLYQATTGEVPFKSRDWYELARMHVEAPPKALRAIRPDLSKRFERIVLRCLGKHPDDRYPSAADLLTDLEDIQRRSRPTSEIPVPKGYLTETGSVPPVVPKEEEKKKWWKF